MPPSQQLASRPQVRSTYWKTVPALMSPDCCPQSRTSVLGEFIIIEAEVQRVLTFLRGPMLDIGRQIEEINNGRRLLYWFRRCMLAEARVREREAQLDVPSTQLYQPHTEHLFREGNFLDARLHDENIYGRFRRWDDPTDNHLTHDETMTCIELNAERNGFMRDTQWEEFLDEFDQQMAESHEYDETTDEVRASAPLIHNRRR